MVAICEVDGADIGRWMVEQGHAIAYRKYSMAYVPAEDQARAAKAGLWAGEFQNPAEYRHQPKRPPPVRDAGEATGASGPVCLCPGTAPAGDAARGALQPLGQTLLSLRLGELTQAKSVS
jgi:endonuclease YncB( thermonuclease family)